MPTSHPSSTPLKVTTTFVVPTTDSDGSPSMSKTIVSESSSSTRRSGASHHRRTKIQTPSRPASSIMQQPPSSTSAFEPANLVHNDDMVAIPRRSDRTNNNNNNHNTRDAPRTSLIQPPTPASADQHAAEVEATVTGRINGLSPSPPKDGRPKQRRSNSIESSAQTQRIFDESFDGVTKRSKSLENKRVVPPPPSVVPEPHLVEEEKRTLRKPNSSKKNDDPLRQNDENKFVDKKKKKGGRRGSVGRSGSGTDTTGGGESSSVDDASLARSERSAGSGSKGSESEVVRRNGGRFGVRNDTKATSREPTHRLHPQQQQENIVKKANTSTSARRSSGGSVNKPRIHDRLSGLETHKSSKFLDKITEEDERRSGVSARRKVSRVGSVDSGILSTSMSSLATSDKELFAGGKVFEEDDIIFGGRGADPTTPRGRRSIGSLSSDRSAGSHSKRSTRSVSPNPVRSLRSKSEGSSNSASSSSSQKHRRNNMNRQRTLSNGDSSSTHTAATTSSSSTTTPKRKKSVLVGKNSAGKGGTLKRSLTPPFLRTGSGSALDTHPPSPSPRTLQSTVSAVGSTLRNKAAFVGRSSPGPVSKPVLSLNTAAPGNSEADKNPLGLPTENSVPSSLTAKSGTSTPSTLGSLSTTRTNLSLSGAATAITAATTLSNASRKKKKKRLRGSGTLNGVKPLMSVLNDPSNKSCADCRSPLLDPSKVYASFMLVRPEEEVDDEDEELIRRVREEGINNTSMHLKAVLNPDDSNNSTTLNLLDDSLMSVNFKIRHEAFAPEGHIPSTSIRYRPRLRRLQRGSYIEEDMVNSTYSIRFGVFLCRSCGIAHRSMSSNITSQTSPSGPPASTVSISAATNTSTSINPLSSHIRVKRLQSDTWSPLELHSLSTSGTNSFSRLIYEHSMPDHWKDRIPSSASTVEEREVFVRAKYETLAFVFSNGPLSSMAWDRLLRRNGWYYSKSVRNLDDSSLKGGGMQGSFVLEKNLLEVGGASVGGSSMQAMTMSGGVGNVGADTGGNTLGGDELPTRLIDYFCVVGSNGKFERVPGRKDGLPNFRKCRKPEDVALEPVILDCFPSPTGAGAYPDMNFPQHVSKFVFPDGCRPREKQLSPSFFTFALTLESGTRMYGAALHVHDETVEIERLAEMARENGYDGELPSWIEGGGTETSSPGGNTTNQTTPKSMKSVKVAGSARPKTKTGMIFLPRSLILLSHYPFFHLYRTFLRQLYRISLGEAPLPIERYIANFCSEIPLPPQGRIEVKFGFIDESKITFSRPATNRLPLVGISHRPLFACLSAGNVMAVAGCLLQETRVALCSRHYGMLGPVAEGLLSLLFPFVWQGMYIPVAPYDMLDILDAPVPFLVGLHSRYLTHVPSSRRPVGVVFVDLDEDIVHLGYNDEDGAGGALTGRTAPALPERDAAKLKGRLTQNGADSVYLMPESRKKGRMTYGNAKALPNHMREPYAAGYTASPAANENSNSSGAAGGAGGNLNTSSHKGTSASTSIASQSRARNLSQVDRAFVDDEHLEAINGFATEEGILTERDVAKTDEWKIRGMKKVKAAKKRGSNLVSESDVAKFQAASGASNGRDKVHLLDLEDSEDFSVEEIRNAFLRFFVSLFKNYEKYIVSHDNKSTSNSDPVYEGNFRAEAFVTELKLPIDHRNFMSSIVSTQMFERFIEERKASPNQPEVRFFDESIVAKNNRSKQKTLMKIGKKKETPFLSDHSGVITETFTPPPPSNWGLPDDGRFYRYGKFPKLNQDLFGKVRSPKQWHQYSKSRRRGTTEAALLQQQKIMSKLMMRNVASSSPSKQASSTKTDIEWAIHALAYKDVKSTNPKEEERRKGILRRKGGIRPDVLSLPDDAIPKAQRMLQAARRKQSILLALVIQFQACWRMHSARARFKRLRRAIIALQRSSRKAPANNELLFDKLTVLISSVVAIQRLCRAYRARRLLIKHQDSILFIQSWTRGRFARRAFLTQKYAAIMLQKRMRGSTTRMALERLTVATTRIQALARGRRIRFAYKLIRDYVACIQARFRGVLTRKQVHNIRKLRVSRYRYQMFDLWRRASTPLAYRAKFWMFIDGSGFLHLSLIENELSRLWALLNVDFSKMRASVSDVRGDTLISGISTSRFSKSVQVQNILEAARKKSIVSDEESVVKPIVPVFPAECGVDRTHSCREKIIQLENAADRLSMEKLQIYERLKAYKDKGELGKIYSMFDISMNEKKKKHRLVEIIWEMWEKVNQSAYAVLSFFPELDGSAMVGFVKPSKKGMKRYAPKGSGFATPSTDEKTLWVKEKIDALIKSDLKEIVLAFIQGVQTLMNRHEVTEDMFLAQFSRQRDAIMAGGKSHWSWSHYRFLIARRYLYIEERCSPSSHKSRKGSGTPAPTKHVPVNSR